MIKVTRIAGESFDLETKQELPKALILSNGKREYTIYIDDETAKAVVELMMESPAVSEEVKKGNGKRSSTNTRPPAPRPQVSEPVVIPVTEPAGPPPMATVGDEPEPEMDDNSGFEPGEEYNDPATGAESL